MAKRVQLSEEDMSAFEKSAKIGLLAIVLPADEAAALMTIADDPTNKITIDLESQTVVTDDFRTTFDIDTFTKHCLLNGLDGIDLTLAHADEIDGYEEQRPAYKPAVSP